MGIVWQAQDERLHRTVALKQLLLPAGLSPADTAAARARAMREGRIAARLQHANAISVYDVVEQDGHPWLVMEYLSSRSLAAVINQQGSLPPEEAASIGARVALALCAAHEVGVVHRDVKPANILLGDDGSVKITDFGISRASGDVTLTATGLVAGTPAYLSPEMARGETPAPPSDVFSLGSTLYMAVEGQAPFGRKDNPLAMLHSVAEGRFPPPRQAGRLTALLMRLMRATPGERPTMQQAQRALAGVAAGQTVPAEALEPEHTSQPAATRQTAAPAAASVPAHQATTTQLHRPSTVDQRESLARKEKIRTIVVSAIAVLIAAAIGIGIASLLMSGHSSAQAPTSATLPTTQITTTADQITTVAAAPTHTTVADAPKKVTARDTEKLIRSYYRAVPGNTTAGWHMLSPAVQAKSKGRKGYNSFWRTISHVAITKYRPVGNDSALTHLRFTKTDGHAVNEVHSFTVSKMDGHDVISASALAS
jgi:hypothetical protein